MQITYNQSELETIVSNHILVTLPGVTPEDVSSVALNEDGSVTIIIGEEASHEDDTPPVVGEDKPVQRRRRRKANPAEAKHVPVEAKKELEQPAETQTSTGGQNESSTQEVEPEGDSLEKAAAAPEEVTEEATSEDASQEAEVKQEVQEEKAAETPAAKPSLFANLKR